MQISIGPTEKSRL